VVSRRQGYAVMEVWPADGDGGGEDWNEVSLAARVLHSFYSLTKVYFTPTEIHAPDTAFGPSQMSFSLMKCSRRRVVQADGTFTLAITPAVIMALLLHTNSD
jgi:hypothetical protein